MIKVLHTGDWHLGRRFAETSLEDEQEAFLDWLAGVVEKEDVDVLVVAGDVFDTVNPPTGARTLYYRLLSRLASVEKRGGHPVTVAVVAGNHDSGALLAASKDVLEHLDVHVVGVPSQDPAADVVEVLRERKDGRREALVMGLVPYINPQAALSGAAALKSPVGNEDGGVNGLKQAAEDASDEDDVEGFDERFARGVELRYRAAGAEIERRRAALAEAGWTVSTLVTGHHFFAGGSVAEGDEVRRVGTLGGFPVSFFPEVDYVALGHIHRAQRLGLEKDAPAGSVPGARTPRRNVVYAGAPFRMNFSEHPFEPTVALVTFDGERHPDEAAGSSGSSAAPDCTFTLERIPVPGRRDYVRLKGGLDSIARDLAELEEKLEADDRVAFVEAVHEGESSVGAPKAAILEAADRALGRTPLRGGTLKRASLVLVRNATVAEDSVWTGETGNPLVEMTPAEVFMNYLEGDDTPASETAGLVALYERLEGLIADGSLGVVPGAGGEGDASGAASGASGIVVGDELLEALAAFSRNEVIGKGLFKEPDDEDDEDGVDDKDGKKDTSQEPSGDAPEEDAEGDAAASADEEMSEDNKKKEGNEGNETNGEDAR